MRKVSKTGIALVGSMVVCVILALAVGVPNGFFGGDGSKTDDMNDEKTPGIEEVMDGQTPLFIFDKKGGVPLMEAMKKDEIVSVHLLYDQGGANLPMESTDPEVIRSAYKATKNITVRGDKETDMSVTDSYHYVYFTLKDGTEIGYRFEGQDIICIPDESAGGALYEISGSQELWKLYSKLAEE